MFLRLVPVGNIPRDILESIKSGLEDYLGIKCRIMPKMPVPKEAFNQWRKQYNAEVILEELSKTSEAKFIDKNIPTFLITNHDIYYERLNFVFGLEDPSKSSAIVSIARLRPEFYDEKADANVLKERTVKEVIHEMGHYLGLEHCFDTKCVMSFSPSVTDVDVKKRTFCDNCRIKLLSRGISVRG